MTEPTSIAATNSASRKRKVMVRRSEMEGPHTAKRPCRLCCESLGRAVDTGHQACTQWHLAKCDGGQWPANRADELQLRAARAGNQSATLQLIQWRAAGDVEKQLACAAQAVEAAIRARQEPLVQDLVQRWPEGRLLPPTWLAASLGTRQQALTKALTRQTRWPFQLTFDHLISAFAARDFDLFGWFAAQLPALSPPPSIVAEDLDSVSGEGPVWRAHALFVSLQLPSELCGIVLCFL